MEGWGTGGWGKGGGNTCASNYEDTHVGGRIVGEEEGERGGVEVELGRKKGFYDARENGVKAKKNGPLTLS